MPSEAAPAAVTDQQRRETLARFRRDREAWDRNPALRELYATWYRRLGSELSNAPPGRKLEIGSGPGFAREFIPDLELTDLVGAEWHDHELRAESLPFEDGSVGALVLFDVLHHLSSPRSFFIEASRVLADGGLVLLCEPYIGPLSYPVYKFLHEEPVRMWKDPLREDAAHTKDPFDSNQAIPTLLFGPYRSTFERMFPEFRIAKVERLAGLSYPVSGGFSRSPLVPDWLFRGLVAVESQLPKAAFSLFGFRMLAVLQKR